MANSIRLSNNLIEEAEKQTKQTYRSVTKQIEYWATLGKEVESSMTPADVAALANGEVEIKVLRKKSEPVKFDAVFSDLEKSRETGQLKSQVLTDPVWYEESKDQPNMLVRVSPGKREIGAFINGKFETAKKAKKSK